VLDFACGSGSLLLNVRKRMGPQGIGKIYGQEKNITTYNLARVNMLLHMVKDTNFDIFHGNTLLNEWDIMREQNLAKQPRGSRLWSCRWIASRCHAASAEWEHRKLAVTAPRDVPGMLMSRCGVAGGWNFLRLLLCGAHHAER
jgi:type I restriction enzyme M protein